MVTRIMQKKEQLLAIVLAQSMKKLHGNFLDNESSTALTNRLAPSDLTA